MKATELRIGNLFIEEFSGELIKVIELTADCITFTGSFDGKWQAQPIPLTEKWLDKTPPTIDGCETSFHEHFADETIWFLHIGREFAVQIKYVHQLQNLIFALTGEELLYND